MRNRGAWVLGTVVVAILGLSLRAYGQEKKDLPLPTVVKEAIQAAYPTSQVLGTRLERNLKYRATVYIVELRTGILKDEEGRWRQPDYVVLTEQGTIIYASGHSRTTDVPLRAKIALKKEAGEGEGGPIIRYEMFVDEKLAKYDKPRMEYQVLVSFRDEKGNSIPGKKPFRVYVAEDGTMVEKNSWIEDTDLPEGLVDAVSEATMGSDYVQVWKDETFVDEKMEKLATPRVEYEVSYGTDKKTGRIRYSANGNVIDQIPLH